MEISDKEKLKLSEEGIIAFLGQFPNNTHSNIVLDVLLDEIKYYSEKNRKTKNSIPLPGSEGQTGSQISDPSS